MKKLENQNEETMKMMQLINSQFSKLFQINQNLNNNTNNQNVSNDATK